MEGNREEGEKRRRGAGLGKEGRRGEVNFDAKFPTTQPTSCLCIYSHHHVTLNSYLD